MKRATHPRVLDPAKLLPQTGLFAFCGLLALGLLASWHYLPWATFHNELPAAIGLSALAFAIGIAGKTCTPVASHTSLALLLMAAIPAAQYAAGLITFSGDALLASLYLTGAAAAHVAGLSLATRDREQLARALAVTFLFGALASVLLAGWQWTEFEGAGMWLSPLAPGGRPYANLAQPNNFASLLCLGLAAALYLRERGDIGRTVFGLAALLLIAGMAMSRSRTPFLVLIAFGAWAICNRRRLGLNSTPAEHAAIVGAFVALWVSWPYLSDALGLSAGGYAGERLAPGMRPVIWSQLWDAALRQPLAGYGWNQISVAQIAVAAEHPHSVFVEHSHNIVLDLLVWNGLAIGAVLIAAAGWWLVTRAKDCASIEAWFALLVIGALGIHALLEFPLDYAYFLFPAALCAGLVDSGQPGLRTFNMPRLVLIAAALGGAALLVRIAAEYSELEDRYRQTRFELIDIGRTPSPAPEATLLTQIAAHIAFAGTQPRPHMSTADIAWMRTVAHRYPYAPSLFRLALVLGLNDRHEEARLELIRLRQLHSAQRFSEIRERWIALAEIHPRLRAVAPP